MSALLFADERSWFSVPAANEPTVTPPIMNPRIMIMTIHRKYRRFDEIAPLGFLKSKYANSEYTDAAIIIGKMAIYKNSPKPARLETPLTRVKTHSTAVPAT